MKKQFSLHVMLVTRLVLVAVLIASVMVVLTMHNDQARNFKVVRDRALIRTGILKALVQRQIDAHGEITSSDLQAMLQVVSFKGYDLQTGHFVFLRVLDTAGRELARTVDTSNPDIALLVRHVDTALLALTPKISTLEVTRVDFGNSRFLRAYLPLLDSQEKTAFNVEGYFATSREEAETQAKELVKAILMSIGTVLATTLLLYPVILRLLRRLARLSRSLLDSNLEALQALGSAIAKRDSDTDLHNFRVTLYSVRIAEALGLDNATIRTLIKGAFLHDIGKIGVRDNILLKPGKLSKVEFEEMKLHVDHGIDIVTRSQWIGKSLPVVGCHHEKVDGSGYPTGLRGEDIPLLARIFAVADVFDALISHRPYKEPMGYDDAIAILCEGRGNHFDSDVLDVFLKVAKPLFERYGNVEGGRPRQDLAQIIKRYFNVDIAEFLD